MTKDTNVCKLSGTGKCDRGKQLLTTIHMHPIRTFAEEGRRQNFSGVDIASEFCKARDEDKEYTLFLTYPKLGLTNRKNRIKAVVFPNRDVVLKAMSASNPGVDPMSISVEGRDKVDWIKFQSSLKDLGYIEEIEIEPTVGAPPTTNLNLIGMIVIGAVAVGGLLYWNKVRKEQSSPVDTTVQ